MLQNYLGWRSAGVETRGNSAIDIALWDLFGKAHGQPVCDMLGGRSRDTHPHLQHLRRLPATSATARAQTVANWGLGERRRPYEDLDALPAPRRRACPVPAGAGHHRHEDLAVRHRRRAQPAATTSRRPSSTRRWSRSTRSARPSATRWTSWSSSIRCGACPMAKKLAARARAEFDTYWHEDPFRLDNLGDLKEYAQHSKAWVCASETLAYTHAFREYLETGVAGVAMLDLSWCGGLTEARKIAALAEAWHVPVAPHDCTGPVVYAASCHFSLHARNALIQESVRAFYTGWYTELVTELPVDHERRGHGEHEAGPRDRPPARVVEAARRNCQSYRDTLESKAGRPCGPTPVLHSTRDRDERCDRCPCECAGIPGADRAGYSGAQPCRCQRSRAHPAPRAHSPANHRGCLDGLEDLPCPSSESS